MKKEKASNRALKHILCCIVILIVFVVTITLTANAQNVTTDANTDEKEVVPLKPQLRDSLLELNKIEIISTEAKLYDMPRVIEKDIYYYLETEEDTIRFFAKAFGFDFDFIKEDLIMRSKEVDEIEPTNIGSLKSNNKLKKYKSFEYGLIEYFYEMTDLYPNKRSKKHISYKGNSDYIEKLIMYYTNIYDNVDTTLALSIGAAESGYYKVKYMLSKNNVYGGMNSSGLISHENIEIGILKYIRLLSKNYFGKGLINEYLIGKVYCPTKDANGQKIASPHWINLVNTAKTKYKNYTQNITIDEILNTRNT